MPQGLPSSGRAHAPYARHCAGPTSGACDPPHCSSTTPGRSSRAPVHLSRVSITSNGHPAAAAAYVMGGQARTEELLRARDERGDPRAGPRLPFPRPRPRPREGGQQRFRLVISGARTRTLTLVLPAGRSPLLLRADGRPTSVCPRASSRGGSHAARARGAAFPRLPRARVWARARPHLRGRGAPGACARGGQREWAPHLRRWHPRLAQIDGVPRIGDIGRPALIFRPADRRRWRRHMPSFAPRAGSCASAVAVLCPIQ